MAKVKIGFSGLSVIDQVMRGFHICEKMKGNVNFTDPKPTLAVFRDSVVQLEEAYRKSRDRDRKLIQIMDIRRAEMLELVRQLAAYVQVASMGDEEKIRSSGFDVVKKGAARPHVHQVMRLRLRQGASPASLRAIWQAVTGAESYEIQLSMDGPDDKFFRHYLTVVGSRVNLLDLEAGRIYWVRVRAVGRKGYGTWSNTGKQTASLD